jgi:hypothetical protein
VHSCIYMYVQVFFLTPLWTSQWSSHIPVWSFLGCTLQVLHLHPQRAENRSFWTTIRLRSRISKIGKKPLEILITNSCFKFHTSKFIIAVFHPS